MWDVGQATHISNFTIGNRPLVDIQWLTTNVCTCVIIISFMCKCNSLMCMVVYIIVCYVLLLCVYNYVCV